MAGCAAALDQRRAGRPLAISDAHRLAIQHDQELPCEPSHLRPFSRARAARSYGATLLLTETILRQNAQPTPALTSPARRRPDVLASDRPARPFCPAAPPGRGRPARDPLAAGRLARTRRPAGHPAASPVPLAAAPARRTAGRPATRPDRRATAAQTAGPARAGPATARTGLAAALGRAPAPDLAAAAALTVRGLAAAGLASAGLARAGLAGAGLAAAAGPERGRREYHVAADCRHAVGGSALASSVPYSRIAGPAGRSLGAANAPGVTFA